MSTPKKRTDVGRQKHTDRCAIAENTSYRDVLVTGVAGL